MDVDPISQYVIAQTYNTCILVLPLQTTGLNEIIPESLLSIFDENELEVCLCTCVDDVVFI